MARYIFITGGVVSSLGKGLMAASLAALAVGATTGREIDESAVGAAPAADPLAPVTQPGGGLDAPVIDAPAPAETAPAADDPLADVAE